MGKRQGNGPLLSRRHYNVGKCPVLSRDSLVLWAQYCVTSLMWTLCRLRRRRGRLGGEWTMGKQLYVKSGESPWLLHVTLAGWKVGVKISLKWFPCLVLTNSCKKLV